MHMYTQSHTIHMQHNYACIFTHNHHTYPWTHTTMCTQDGYCPLHIASRNGHDNIVEMLCQAGATIDLQSKVEDCNYLFFSHLRCCTMQIIQYKLSITNIQGNMNVYPTDNCYWYTLENQIICALEVWVHLVHDPGTWFPNKFEQRMSVWGSLNRYFSNQMCKTWSLIASFGVKQNMQHA